MSAEANKALVRQFFAAANQGQIDALDTFVAPDLTVHAPTLPTPLRGSAAYKQVFRATRAAFPDTTYTLEDVLADGDKVVTRWTVRATQQGEFMGIAASGRAIRMTGISIYRIMAGHVVEIWVNSDDLGFLQQLGAIAGAGQDDASH